MNIGVLLPGFSSDENDWAIPVQLNLVREMARRADVRVLALRYPHRRGSYTVHGAKVCSLGAGQVRGVRRLALWWEALRALRRRHDEKPFSVLHAMWADETGLIAAWAGRWLGIPAVVSIAGGELVGFNDIAYGLQRSAFSRWIVGQALRGADRVVVSCTYIHHMLEQSSYRIPEHRLRTIPLGVDTSVFRPAESQTDSRRLVHVASLVGVKDQATLLRALARLEDVTLDIVGTGPEQLRLEALARQMGISERVHFVGGIHHLDLPSYYQRAALNVLSSRHEGLGMVTLEAAACGIPTVSTAVGLLPDYPQMGVTVPVGDDAALANAIRGLLDNQTYRKAFGQSAYEMATTQFTIQQTVSRLIQLYEELTENC